MNQLHSHPLFQGVAGDTLRPGGLKLTKRLFAAARMPVGSLVLDLGCGLGGSARYLTECWGLRVAGLDREREHLLYGRTRDAAALHIQAEMHKLPLRPGTFDAVLCECVLTLSPKPRSLLQHIGMLLRPKGRLLLTDIYRRGDGRSDAAPFGASGCLAGAASRTVLESGLVGAGLTLDVFEDHSRLLTELGARLIFAGMDIQDFLGLRRAGAARSGTHACYKARPGYCLVMATKNVPQVG